MEFSLRPLHACAVTMVRPHHVVEDRITLFVRPFGAYHVYGTFADLAGSVLGFLLKED